MHKSLDGHIGRPNDERMEWITRDADMNGYMIADLLKTVDTMLLGRALFQGFEQAWPPIAKDPAMPKELRDFANWIENTPKYVFSTTLHDAGWKTSELVRVTGDKDIVDAIAQLRRQPGRDMVVFGGARFARTLARLGLIDEYRFKLEPVALGNGFQLFEDIPQPAKLRLVSSKAFKSGVLGLYYHPEKG